VRGCTGKTATAFERTLPDADIARQKLVPISPSLPPHRAELDRVSGVSTPQRRENTFTALARADRSIGRADV
jgi:pyruvoyl-dependent arginine decarboxylase (PvlArgDC)